MSHSCHIYIRLQLIFASAASLLCGSVFFRGAELSATSQNNNWEDFAQSKLPAADVTAEVK